MACQLQKMVQGSEKSMEFEGVNERAFERAVWKMTGAGRKRIGIGTQSEKTVHAVLKNYYEPDEDCQEIPIGNFVADIYRDGKITEIQTRQFYRLKEKLEAFFAEG